MATQSPKPSCHDVMTGKWTPSGADISAGQLPRQDSGSPSTSSTEGGGSEHNQPTPLQVQDRISYYQQFTGLLNVNPGEKLDCSHIQSYQREEISSSSYLNH
ncbi:glycoside hydrolase family 19 protein [Pajaroellobacter abortibovis]|uniref:glycoside hydrolase family 19 protein n=1 Tax=Pajaroellobacter abortibovis TaxID=1882918 RepID=UPI00094AF575